MCNPKISDSISEENQKKKRTNGQKLKYLGKKFTRTNIITSKIKNVN